MEWFFGRRSWGAREISGGYWWCSGRASTCIMEILHLSCFSSSVFFFLPPYRLNPFLSLFPTAELECPKPKRPGCSIGVSTVWSGARVTLAPEGGLRRYSRAFALRRVGLDRFLGGGSDGAPCGIVSPPPFVYRQRRYVYESYNRNREENDGISDCIPTFSSRRLLLEEGGRTSCFSA